MENRNLQRLFETEQYNNQANLVYFNTLIICAILAPVYYFWIGSPVIAWIQVPVVLAAAMAIILNRMRRYSLGSLLFISMVTLVAVVEVRVFGLAGGFQYFFFNMAGLIMYTSWQPWQKMTGTIAEMAVFIAVYFLTHGREPLTSLSPAMTGFLHTLNVVLNIAGVANSANYFITIATRAHNQVSNLAMRDYLTNLMNRTSYDAFMAEVFETRMQSALGLGILLLDIDFFKQVNDTCGHLCGDELLRQFAAVLAKSTRAGDFCARYGGEEFVIVTTPEHPDQLQHFAERIRREVEAMPFEFGGMEKKVTVSIGALFVPPHMRIDQHQALDRADKLLYQAKAAGRNRVFFDIAEN